MYFTQSSVLEAAEHLITEGKEEWAIHIKNIVSEVQSMQAKINELNATISQIEEANNKLREAIIKADKNV